MPRFLHIVAHCTDRKRIAPPRRLTLRAHASGSLADRLSSWWDALMGEAAEPMPAHDLYVGSHWAAVRDLPEVARHAGVNPSLWVASAGYGLLQASDLVHPYSATFQVGHDDSVSRGTGSDARIDNALWWEALARRRMKRSRAPRSIRSIAAETPDAAILVVASNGYLQAIEADLLAAAQELKDSQRLLLVSGEPGPKADALRSNWIRSTSALLHEVGGARTALHARVARMILRDAARYGLEAAETARRVARITKRCPPPVVYDRTPSDDGEVMKFIRVALAMDDKATHTGLLRQWRQSGRACEQGRFRDLFLRQRDGQ